MPIDSLAVHAGIHELVVPAVCADENRPGKGAELQGSWGTSSGVILDVVGLGATCCTLVPGNPRSWLATVIFLPDACLSMLSTEVTQNAPVTNSFCRPSSFLLATTAVFRRCKVSLLEKTPKGDMSCRRSELPLWLSTKSLRGKCKGKLH